MGRIAYLTKRGNIWWFRRKYPVLFIKTPQNNLISGLCVETGKRAQAKGHLAVSLQTSSKREARLIGAQVSADFERAWIFVEEHMSETDPDQDFIDAMAMTITEGFRRHTKVMRAGGVSGLDPQVREKAYGMLEADLRSALGVKEPKPAEGTTVIMPAVEARGYDGTCASEDDFPPPAEDPWVLTNADTDGLSEEERFDLHLIKMFELNTLAFRSEFARYLEACQRLGRDPMKETPVLEMALTETLETAQSFGLTQPPTTASASDGTHQAKLPVEKTPLFSVFAETYLNYRCQGYQFQKEDEAPHLPTGKSFERNSFRNWKASVRIFTEIVGDLRL